MKNETVLLRPYAEAEIPDLQKLERAAHRRYLALQGFEKFAAAPAIAAERFRSGHTTVAEIDGQIVGYIIVQPLDDMLYIASLMVDDGMSGKGIGRQLLGWATEYANSIEAAATCLATFREPRWNAPWYAAQGYSEIPRARIGAGLQAILDRHATFLDMSSRVAMWKPAPRAQD